MGCTGPGASPGAVSAAELTLIDRKGRVNQRGKDMASRALEHRVAAREQELAALKVRGRKGRQKDWRRTIGLFTDNPGMKELFAEAMKLREADRRKARRRSLQRCQEPKRDFGS